MAGPFMGPYLEPSKLKGALEYAPQAASEQPLAVVDDSITGSAKAGMLVTDSAVYFSEGRLRVPVELIVEPPVHTKVPGEKGQLRTAQGVVSFDSTLDEVRRAMCNTLRAIAFFNRGGSRLRYGNAPVSGPVGEIAARVLVHPKLPVVPSVAMASVHAASNGAAGWLDYDSGEELLVFLDESGGGHGDRFVALSDRALLALIDEHPVIVRYDSLQSASVKTGILSHTLTLHSTFGTSKIDSIAASAAVKLVADFLQELTRLPPELRRSLAPIAPAADDPSGAAAAMQMISWPDLRVATLLELVHQSVASSAMPVEAGCDMVARVARLQRTLRGGHGSTQGWSRTPLSAADFELLLSSVFGPPIRQTMLDARTGLLEYDVRRAGSAAGTIASNVIGVTLLAVVGVGWISTGSGSSSTVRVRIMEAPLGAGFLLSDAQDNPLAKENAAVAGGLLESLAMLSAAVLLRRVLLGWNVSPQALVAEPVASLDARARALVPQVDLAPFNET